VVPICHYMPVTLRGRFGGNHMAPRLGCHLGRNFDADAAATVLGMPESRRCEPNLRRVNVRTAVLPPAFLRDTDNLNNNCLPNHLCRNIPGAETDILIVSAYLEHPTPHAPLLLEGGRLIAQPHATTLAASLVRPMVGCTE